ncbi:hypothetical protein AVEN_71240-1 [Araneus ventricosus]|uniref:Uncharacterized protein n=1 Tax=Araneus ventricosus TaxID=182803 RepID=A0A4Y2Q5F9_ARAVE|nr:hypothetical protein AVEN_71240-1 [Araneus ventricosus]
MFGREFYRGNYGMTGSSQAWIPDLRDKVGDHLGVKFGDEIWDPKGAGIFSISLLGEEIRLNVLDHIVPCDVKVCRGRLYKKCAWITDRL